MKEVLKKYMEKYFSSSTKRNIILGLIIITLLSTIYSMKKTITVNIDGVETQIVTYRTDIKSALKTNGIELGEKDKITSSSEGAIKDGDKVYIERAVTVTLAADGQELVILTAEPKVEDFLEAEGIALGAEDKISSALTDEIAEGMKITINRVSSEVIKETQSVDFGIEYRKDNNLDKGKDKVLQEGVTGQKELSIKVVYQDGVEISREVVGETVTAQPVSKVVAQGNRSLLSFSRGGTPVAYTDIVTVKSTAYDPVSCPGTRTATGTTPRRNSSGYSTIAVDPSVIPLGTKVYVQGYGFAIAEDTGGAINGNKIDVYFNSYGESINWGVRSVKVYILAS